MTPAQKRQIRNEVIVGSCINALLNLLASYLVFGGLATISYCCSVKSLTADAVPHSFAVSFMATLVPSFIVLGRVLKGKVQGCPPVEVWPPRVRRRILARAVMIGGLGSVAGLLIHLAASWFVPPLWSLPSVLAFKAVYGAMVSVPATYVALRLLFADLALLVLAPERGVGQ